MTNMTIKVKNFEVLCMRKIHLLQIKKVAINAKVVI